MIISGGKPLPLPPPSLPPLLFPSQWAPHKNFDRVHLYTECMNALACMRKGHGPVYWCSPLIKKEAEILPIPPVVWYVLISWSIYLETVLIYPLSLPLLCKIYSMWSIYQENFIKNQTPVGVVMCFLIRKGQGSKGRMLVDAALWSPHASI